MCGVCGVVNAPRPAEAALAVDDMTAMLVRRGPDDRGRWSSPDGRAQFGHRRLSIIDLTEGGHQPMVSADGGGVLVYNGELYNHRELAADLRARGVHLRSRSDSEVLLELLRLDGRAALERCNGMFAFAYYEPASGRLLLARDHAGIKPLCYATEPGGPGVAFASRYDALLRTGWIDPDRIRRDVLSLYLDLRHVPAPFALHENGAQVEPGGYVEVGPGGVERSGRWWHLPTDRAELTGAAAREAVGEALHAAVERQLVADVPVGVFLSGGVDSPLVAASARKICGPDLKSFTIGYPGWDGDEGPDADRFAALLDLRHEELKVTDGDVARATDDAVAASGEPLGDYSILPSLLVSGLARRAVTVALSGDGGDELFFGYERPRSLLKQTWGWRLPYPVRRGLLAASNRGVGRFADALGYPDPGRYYRSVHGTAGIPIVEHIAPGLPAWPESYRCYVAPAGRDDATLAGFARRVEFEAQLQRVLKKLDMASMHHSLEVRVPILDREVIEVAHRIGYDEHLHGGTRKAVLVDLLATHVPPATISSAKRGFGSPLTRWLAGPLRERVADTLLGSDLSPAGVFDRTALADLIDKQQTEGDRAWAIWTVLSLQWWQERARTLRGTM